MFSGGTLKIYGESLRPDVPYKTLLLSAQDPAWYVVKETLEKYGMEKEDIDKYCLVQVGDILGIFRKFVRGLMMYLMYSDEMHVIFD